MGGTQFGRGHGSLLRSRLGSAPILTASLETCLAREPTVLSSEVSGDFGGESTGRKLSGEMSGVVLREDTVVADNVGDQLPLLFRLLLLGRLFLMDWVVTSRRRRPRDRLLGALSQLGLPTYMTMHVVSSRSLAPHFLCTLSTIFSAALLALDADRTHLATASADA